MENFLTEYEAVNDRIIAATVDYTINQRIWQWFNTTPPTSYADDHVVLFLTKCFRER